MVNRKNKKVKKSRQYNKKINSIYKKKFVSFFQGLNQYKVIAFGIILCLIIFVVVSNYSYSYFKKEDIVKKFDIIVGNFSYVIQSDEFNNTHQVTVSENDILEFVISVTSLNEIASRYQIYYDDLSIEGVSVYYIALPNFDDSFGEISSEDTKKVKIRVENNTSEEVILSFGITGGLVNNQEIEVDSTKVKVQNSTLNTLVSFDANGGNVDDIKNTFTYGESFNSLPTPIRRGYVFEGWYTEKENGKKVEDTTVFNDATIETLYAHWTSLLLIDNVKIGDYVDYNVYYKNVAITINTSNYKADDTIYGGWRVIGFVEDEETGERYVKLTTAGIPLTYKHTYSTTDATVGTTSVKNLTTNFFSTEIDSTATNNKYHLCGFLKSKGSSEYITDIDDLKPLFNNEFTRTISNGNLMVESIRNDDLKKALDILSNKTDSVIENLTDLRDYELLAIPSSGTSGYVPYFSADIEQNYYLWASFASGYVVYTYGERGVRPVVSLKSDVIISSNNVMNETYGTYENPILIEIAP